ncbi:MAG: hypothetical protein IJ767_02100 [Bacteroidaceae bacterium]|nr:hypothetical protein [Bacteroidaceae bacterium]
MAAITIISSCESEEPEVFPQVNSTEANASFAAGGSENYSNRSSIEEYNLLENGGLEQWQYLFTPEMPSGWYLPSNEYTKCNSRIVYEGRFSAIMKSETSGKTARLAQLIPIPNCKRIHIRFHYYVEQWKSKGARTYCYFRTEAAEKYNISADELQTFYGKDTYYVIRGGGKGLTYLPHSLNVWQTFDETIDVPPAAKYFFFGVNSYYGTTIYVDDCWVIDVTEQVPTGIKDVRM